VALTSAKEVNVIVLSSLSVGCFVCQQDYAKYFGQVLAKVFESVGLWTILVNRGGGLHFLGAF